MRSIISLIMALMFACTVHAQKDVTTFLGIPVDGTETEMKEKLIAKGFTPESIGGKDFLEGEFNGCDVSLRIVTNNNKVFRIMVADANNQDEASIKIRFNKLVNQFENNKRYVYAHDFEIPDSEDISYEMTVNDKVYEAVFFQIPDIEKVDTTAVRSQAREELLKDFSEEQLNNPTEDDKQAIENKILSMQLDLISKKAVWFMICELYGGYYITMFYDNEYNRAHGEDL